jgi:hypothetical protein
VLNSSFWGFRRRLFPPAERCIDGEMGELLELSDGFKPVDDVLFNAWPATGVALAEGVLRSRPNIC